MKTNLQNESRLRNGLIVAQTALFVVVSTLSALGAGIRIGTNTTVSFARVAEGRELLTRRDEFIAALTPLDRRARMRSEQEVSEKDLLEFVSRSVRAWTPDESNRVASVLQTVSGKLAQWHLPFPPTILLIKTSGEEEFNNAYTRENAIVFPAAETTNRPSVLRYFILHELFHVLSRHDPELRKALYGVIGFKLINEIVLPEEIGARKVTNPDGVQNGWMIGLTNQTEAVQAVPILLATGPRFDPNEHGASPYDYFRLLVVKPDGTNWSPQLLAARSRLLQPMETSGWFEQIGRNTRYTIHPDEILADNFVHLINGNTNLPTPRILTEMADTFGRRRSMK